MKRAYQYIRISQKDQSNWSIQGQKDLITQYAQRHDIQIVQTFVDDGKSARDFNRPDWKKLEKELSKNRHNVDFLIIAKFDRLIRNTLQGLQQLSKLEDKWKVQVLSAMESYAIDPTDPMYFKIRADLLVNAEFERRVISDRSKFGVWQAKLQGRHIGQAPFGYKNQRDERNKPIIVIDEEKAEIVKEIFTRYIAGEKLGEIRANMVKMGYKRKGKSSITRMVSNPVYAGLVRVPSYKKEPEKMIKGLHEPIVSEYVYYKAYERLNKSNRHVKVILSDDLYLRGLLICEGCGRLLTGSKSKGNGGIYHYYRCQDCRGQNHNARHAHDQLFEVFETLQFHKQTVNEIHGVLYQMWKEEKATSKDRVKVLKKDIAELTQKIDSLEEKYIKNLVTSQTYDKWMSRFVRDLGGKQTELSNLENMTEQVLFTARQSLDKLTMLNDLFQDMDVTDKQEVFKFIFPAGCIKTQRGYRTNALNELFMHNALKFRDSTVFELVEKGEKFDFGNICTPNATIIELLGDISKLFKAG